MPRNGSDIYYIPPGTEGFPDTTIESEKYNNYIHDVETDLNRPRPISAGGTGADDADEALANLGAEKSSQRVDNYDSHIWLPGSFYSLAGATGAPPLPAGQVATHKFVGWVVSSDIPATPPANQNVVVHARDQNDITVPGRIYVREKKAGTWGPWSIDGTGVVGPNPPLDPPDGLLWWDSESGQLFVWYRDVDTAQWVIASPSPDPAQFLLKAGDTMEGTLGLAHAPTQPLHAANKSYVDAVPASMQPQLDGKVNKSGDTMTGQLAVNSSILTSVTPTTGTIYFGGGSNYLNYNGSNYALSGSLNAVGAISANSLTVAGTISGGTITSNQVFAVSLASAPTQGTIHFGNTGSVYLTYGGTSFQLNGGPLLVNGNLSANGNIVCTASGASFAPPNGAIGGFICKNGSSNGHTGSYFNIGFDGNANLYIDNTSFGTIGSPSDYRIKKDVASIDGTWENVKALNPVKYTHKDFTLPSTEERKGLSLNGDDIERWGFIAHELQEALIDSAATAKKDAPDAIQSVDAMTVIAALTKALQEAMARIEALEAKV